MLNAGEVLNARYRVERVVGQGGMGAVYLATHLELDEQVAIKEMLLASTDPAQRAAMEQQFRVEARILNRLRHPNLPRVYDFFEIEGRHYLVMDFIKGGTLEDFRDKGRIEEEKMLQWTRELCEVLAYLHSYNPPVIFRDLKPANIMLDEDSIRLIDFGIAKVFEADQGAQTKTVLQGAASHGFAAPEQYGLGGTDARSDIYSLGATLYALLTSRQPPPSMELAAGIAELTPLRELRPDLSESTVSTIEWMMQFHRDMRPPSIAAVQEAFGFTKAGAGGPQASLPQQMRRVLREEFHHFFPLQQWLDRGNILKTVLAGLAEGGKRLPMFSVVGEPGLGKSRLLQEVATRAADDFEVLPIAHGALPSEKQPLGVLLPSVGAWVRRYSEEVLPLLQGQFDTQTLSEASELLPELKPLFRTKTALPSRGPLEREASTTAVIAAVLEEAARDVPVLLLLDDMQWTDEATLKFLDSIRVGDLAGKVAIILSVDATGPQHACRTFINRWSRRGEMIPISLPFLTREDAAAYVQASFPPIDGLERQLDLLLEKSHGNPLLLEEILRFMVVRRYILEKNGILGVTEFRGDTLPSTLEDAVRRRREHLPLETQTLLGQMSVAGVRFDLRTALKLSGESTSALTEALARAVETLFVLPGERGVYEFTSDAAREVFYHGLPAEERIALHRKMATMEEERAARSGDASLAAYHNHMVEELEEADTTEGGDGGAARVIEVYVGDAFELKEFKEIRALGPQEVEDALDALSMLLKGARTLNMYWASGQISQTSFGTAMGIVRRLVRDFGTVGYTLAGETFYVNKVPVNPDKMPAELRSVLTRHRISGFEFQPGVNDLQMKSFLELLTGTREAIQSAGGWTAACKAHKIAHVVVSEIVYVGVAERDLFDPAHLTLTDEVVIKLAASGKAVNAEQADFDLDRIDDMLATGVVTGASDVVLEQLNTLKQMLETIRKGGPAVPAAPAPINTVGPTAPVDAAAEAQVTEVTRELLRLASPEDIKRLLSLAQTVDVPLKTYLATRTELLVQGLEQSDERRRTMAAIALVNLGDEARRRLLYYLRTSDNPTGRATAMFLLARSEADPAQVLTEEILRCATVDGGVRLLKAMQMAQLDWTVALTNLLHSPLVEIRQGAMEMLLESQLPHREKLDLLLALLQADDLVVIDDAVNALGDLQDEHAVAPLSTLMEKLFSRKTPEAVRVEEHICHTLGRIGSAQALPMLKAVLVRKGFLVGSWESSVRAAAVYALAHLPGPEARDLLSRQVQDPDLNVSKTARFVLARLQAASPVPQAARYEALLQALETEGLVGMP